MISFRSQLQYLFLSSLLFLFYPLTISAPAFPDISLDELAAFEQELAKMSPEEWEALNNEINNTINSMSEEDRNKLFAEAALEAERLEAEFKKLRESETSKENYPAPKVNDNPSPKKKEALVVKPKVSQTEKIKNLEILNKLSDNLDYLHLIVASSPLVKVKLESKSSWLNFLDDYYLFHSIVNSLINNESLQENLLMSEWDNLRAEIIKWNNALNLIKEIQYSDDDESISPAEAEVITSFIDKFLTENSTKTLTWSLKRVMQKYAEEELKKIEQYNKENKQVYRQPITAKKDITSVKLGFPAKKNAPNIQNKSYAPKSATPMSPAGSKSKKASIDENDNKPKSQENDSSKTKSANDKGKPIAKDDKIEVKNIDEDSKKDKTASTPDKKSEKKDNSFVQKPEKRLFNKLNKITQDIEAIAKGINDDVFCEEPNLDIEALLQILRSNFYDRLIILSFELGQIQLDLMEFYNKDGKPDVKIKKDLADLLADGKSFATHSLAFAELKDKFATLRDVSSFDIVSALNKEYKIDKDLKKRSKDFLKNYNSLMKNDSIKPSNPNDSEDDESAIPADVIKNPEYLILDIADRLLNITSLSDSQFVSDTAKQKLQQIRLVN